MRSATRRLEIDAGHRVTRHESKCRNVHGHRYVFDVEVGAPDLDTAGRVIDFGDVKAIVGGWLDLELDHGYLCRGSDPVRDLLLGEGFKVFTMPGDLEPTAENLAEVVYRRATELLADRGLTVLSVRCFETPNCWSTYP